MATRATYQFKTNYTAATVYIHWDGYLQGAAHYFNEALNAWKANRKRDVISSLLACFVYANDQATITGGHEAHGDTDFRYDVECKGGNFQIKAYKRVSYSSEAFELVFIGSLDDFITNHLMDEAA